MYKQRQTVMLSRVADSLYWMSRYLERAEHTARLIEVDLQLRLDQSPESGAGRWRRVLDALHAPVPEEGKVDATSLTQILTLDRTNPSSILSCVAAARENLRQVREQCSTEMWEQLNRLYLQVTSTTASEAWLLHSHVFFRAVQEGAHLFQGVTDSTMSHGEGWQYIQLGRYVERTDTLAQLIGTHFGRLSHPLDQAVESEEYLEWVGLLKSCAAFEAYCKAYTAELRPLRVAEFLLLNPEFPHSVRFSVDMVHAALSAIAQMTERKVEQPVRLAGRLQATLSFSQIEEIMAAGASAYVDSVRWQCAQAHTAIHQVYFDYSVETALVQEKRGATLRPFVLYSSIIEFPNYSIHRLGASLLIYSVRHVTTFRYEPAVRESVMEVRLHPRSDGDQRCLSFTLSVDPPTHVMQYQDFAGNSVHHFDIASAHSQLKVTAKSTVEVKPIPAPRPGDAGDWADLDALVTSGDHWEMLLPSTFAHSSELLVNFAKETNCERRVTPLELLMELNEKIYQSFSYVPNSTNVDSPIEEALEARQGVCQDFAHIMIALVRRLKIPCRYVSGYMFHRDQTSDPTKDEAKQDRSLEGASHAWVEALIPRLGWIAFDPTNNLVGADRHIRVAIGRDYADVPPTRGVHKGEAQSELSVAVTVSPADAAVPAAVTPSLVVRSRRPVLVRAAATRVEQEQQQQQ